MNIEGKSIEVMHADMSSTAILDYSVNAIFLANVFHDIEDMHAFFEEAKRTSKPGAILVDVDWDKVDTAQGPPFQMRISAEEVEKILAENEFKLGKRIDGGPNHYGLVCGLSDPNR